MTSSNGWSTTTRVIVICLTLVIIGAFTYANQPLIAPLIVAALLAYILTPLARLARNRWPRLGRRGSVSLVYFFFLTLVIATPGTLTPLLIRQARGLSVELENVEAQLMEFLSQPFTFLGQEFMLDEMWTELLDFLLEALAPATENALQVIEATSTSLAWLLVILVTTYYLMLDWRGLKKWFVELAPAAERSDVEKLLEEVNLIWGAYLRGTLLLMLVTAIAFSIIGVIIGLPGGVAIGLITGLMSIIPDLGLLLAGLLAVIVAYFQGSNFLPLPNFWFAILVGVIYLIIWQVKANWIRPRFMGPFLSMNTGLIFIAIVGAVVLYNIFVAMIILPLLATASVIGRYIHCRLLGQNPWPDDKVPSLAEGLIKEPSKEKNGPKKRRLMGKKKRSDKRQAKA